MDITHEELNKISFHNGRAKAGSIKKVRSELYVGSDGSVYEIDRIGLYHKYKQIAPADNEPDYEVCKECGQMHNELAHRTYDNPVLPFSNKQKVIAAPSEGNDMETIT